MIVNLFDFIQEEIRFNTSNPAIHSKDLMNARSSITGITIGTVDLNAETDFEDLCNVAKFFILRTALINLFFHTATKMDAEVVTTLPVRVKDFLLHNSNMKMELINETEIKKIFATTRKMENETALLTDEQNADRLISEVFMSILDSDFPIKYALNYRDIYRDFCENGSSIRYLTRWYYAMQNVAIFEA
jgi:hypothetical protein